jgi:hypothetical protein
MKLKNVHYIINDTRAWIVDGESMQWNIDSEYQLVKFILFTDRIKWIACHET